MRIPVRIFSFVSVAVLLSFFGKVSKVQLFEGFIRTIQDVETRNSTGFNLNQSDLPIAVSAISENSFPALRIFGIPFSGRFILQFIPVQIGEIQSTISREFLPFCRFFLSTQFTAAP